MSYDAKVEAQRITHGMPSGFNPRLVTVMTDRITSALVRARDSAFEEAEKCVERTLENLMDGGCAHDATRAILDDVCSLRRKQPSAEPPPNDHLALLEERARAAHQEWEKHIHTCRVCRMESSMRGTQLCKPQKVLYAAYSEAVKERNKARELAGAILPGPTGATPPRKPR